VRAHELAPAGATRIAIRAQLLDDTTHTDLLDVVWSLTLPRWTRRAVRPAPTSLWAGWGRIPAGRPASALAERRLVELDMMIRPSEDPRCTARR
jgi:hypothetical protein